MVSLIRGKKRIAEIGVFEGVTALQLRAEMDRDATYFAIDPYPVGRLGLSFQKLIAERTVRQSSNGTVVWIRETGVDAATLDAIKANPIDFIFIDGDHSLEGLKSDWDAWSGLVSISGIICLHDSCSSVDRNLSGWGSKQFTDEVVLKDRRFKLLSQVDTLTVLEKTCN